jgi:hypothetical protein
LAQNRAWLALPRQDAARSMHRLRQHGLALGSGLAKRLTRHAMTPREMWFESIVAAGNRQRLSGRLRSISPLIVSEFPPLASKILALVCTPLLTRSACEAERRIFLARAAG